MSITVRVKRDDESIDFQVPTEWESITLKHWGELAYIIKKHQSDSQLKQNSLDEKFSIEGGGKDYDTLTQDVEFLNQLHLNRDIFCYLSGLDREDMKYVDMEQVAKVVNTIGILTEEYKPKGIKSFEFEGETYYFPSEFLKNNTYGDYIEATQLDMYIESMKNGKYDVLPEQMAILCRRMGEEYDEDKIDEKAEKFKQLTMDIVFEFAFFLTNRSENLLKHSSTYLEKSENL
tara:strand:- start:901 stop:1596 length:696 start_codon:yes stop_codon:yes gene_type:complete